jgi:hypothetical protein
MVGGGRRPVAHAPADGMLMELATEAARAGSRGGRRLTVVAWPCCQVSFGVLDLQEWLATIAGKATERHQEDSLQSPATFIAAGFALTLFLSFTSLLVHPRVGSTCTFQGLRVQYVLPWEMRKFVAVAMRAGYSLTLYQVSGSVGVWY